MSEEVILELKSKHQKIKDKLSTVRTVKIGDYVLSEDHNKIVEILQDLSVLLDEIIDAIPPPPPKVISPILLSLRTSSKEEAYGKNIVSGVTIGNLKTTQEYFIEGQPEETAEFTTLKSETVAENSSILGLKSDILDLIVKLKDTIQHEVYSKTVWEVEVQYKTLTVTIPEYTTIKSLGTRQNYFIEGQPEEEADFVTLKDITDTEEHSILAVDENVTMDVKPLGYIRSVDVQQRYPYDTNVNLKDVEQNLIEGRLTTETTYTTLKEQASLTRIEQLSLSKVYTVKSGYDDLGREVKGSPALGTTEKTIEIKKVIW